MKNFKFLKLDEPQGNTRGRHCTTLWMENAEGAGGLLCCFVFGFCFLSNNINTDSDPLQGRLIEGGNGRSERLLRESF